MLHGARFTPKGSFSSIYLASDPITALMEIVSVFDHPNWARSSPPRAVPWTLFTVDGVVANLIDLADAETQELLATNEQELSGIWLTVDKPVTQVLGKQRTRTVRSPGSDTNRRRNPLMAFAC